MNAEDLIKNIENKIRELDKNENKQASLTPENIKKKRFKVDLSNIEEFRDATRWCLDLVKYWTNKDILQILSLFDDNVIYFENPDKLIKPNELFMVWSEIHTQKIISLNYEIIDIFRRHNFADFVLETEEEIVYMTYVFVLNEEHKCIYFMQQYTVEKK